MLLLSPVVALACPEACLECSKGSTTSFECSLRGEDAPDGHVCRAPEPMGIPGWFHTDCDYIGDDEKEEIWEMPSRRSTTMKCCCTGKDDWTEFQCLPLSMMDAETTMESSRGTMERYRRAEEQTENAECKTFKTQCCGDDCAIASYCDEYLQSFRCSDDETPHIATGWLYYRVASGNGLCVGDSTDILRLQRINAAQDVAALKGIRSSDAKLTPEFWGWTCPSGMYDIPESGGPDCQCADAEGRPLC
mmetsp:Transcript_4379/g.9461  ORF Transcript_4379/g.9461 Transcript_4379/m.9461 type:complete len:248 (+) Transcript_4379:20-763(+)